jgi:hypothetical protein
MAVVVLSGHKSMGWQGRHEGGSKIHTRMSKKPLRLVAWSIPLSLLSPALWGLLTRPAAANDIQRHPRPACADFFFLFSHSLVCNGHRARARSQRTKALAEPNIILFSFSLSLWLLTENLYSKHCSSPGAQHS